jgi:hypothetical protein
MTKSIIRRQQAVRMWICRAVLISLPLCDASAEPVKPFQIPKPQSRESKPAPTATLVVNGTPKGGGIKAYSNVTNLVGEGNFGDRLLYLPASSPINVVVSAEGYQTSSFPITLAPSALFTTNVDLKPIPAKLTVKLVPGNARISVVWGLGSVTNGSVGEQISELPPNERLDITATAPGYVPLNANVTIGNGENREWDLGRLAPLITNSWLQVECNPPDASINYQIQDGPKTPLMAPRRLENIPLGKLVTVVGTREGFDMDYRTVTLTNPAGQTVTLNLKQSQASILVKGTPEGADVEVTLDPSHIAKGKINSPIVADWLKALNKVDVKVSSTNHTPQESNLNLRAGRNELTMNLAKISPPAVAVTAPTNASPQGGTDSPPAALGGTNQAISLSGTNSLESKAMAEAFAIQVQFATDYKKEGAAFISPAVLKKWKAQLDKIGSDYTKATGIPMDKKKEPWASIEKVRDPINAYSN